MRDSPPKPCLRPRALVLAMGVAFGSTLACGGERGAVLVDALEPHEETVLRFERWVTRTTSTGAAWQRGSALAETLFTPLRGDASVHAAIVEREGHPEHVAEPTDATVPASLAWTAARSRRLGTVEVGRDPDTTTVLWVRVHPDPEDPALRITLAFDEASAAP